LAYGGGGREVATEEGEELYRCAKMSAKRVSEM